MQRRKCDCDESNRVSECVCFCVCARTTAKFWKREKCCELIVYVQRLLENYRLDTITLTYRSYFSIWILIWVGYFSMPLEYHADRWNYKIQNDRCKWDRMQQLVVQNWISFFSDWTFDEFLQLNGRDVIGHLMHSFRLVCISTVSVMKSMEMEIRIENRWQNCVNTVLRLHWTWIQNSVAHTQLTPITLPHRERLFKESVALS